MVKKVSDTHKEQTVIELFRHGETTAGKCFLGSTDVSLSQLGWQQMKSHKLSGDYDLVLSSPLKRCREFSQAFATDKNLPVKIENEFREIDFGLWEGKTSAELWEQDREKLSEFWNDPVLCTPPEAESLTDFQKRVIEHYYKWLNELKGKKILLVCHAGVIKIILCEILGVELKNMYRLTIDHAGLSQVSLWQDCPQINFINKMPPVDLKC